MGKGENGRNEIGEIARAKQGILTVIRNLKYFNLKYCQINTNLKDHKLSVYYQLYIS